jgi:hypothetical protein
MAWLIIYPTPIMLTTNEYRTGVDAHWTFLSDPRRKVQKDLDIAEYTDPEHNPMIPHVIVLEPRSRGVQDLQRLLVFWPTDHRGASAGPAGCVDKMPSRLGHHDARIQSRLGANTVTFIPMAKPTGRYFRSKSNRR